MIFSICCVNSKRLRVEGAYAVDIRDLPTLNASLNLVATIFLISGYVFIRRQRRVAHRNCMISAFVVSALFLCSYLIYHYNVEAVTRYPYEGLSKLIYFVILFTHIPLATLMVPFILWTFWLAFNGEFARHRRIARWVLPVWIYVSVSGVLIYLMLYVF